MEDNTTPTGLPFSNPATSMKGAHGGHIHQLPMDGGTSSSSRTNGRTANGSDGQTVPATDMLPSSLVKSASSVSGGAQSGLVPSTSSAQVAPSASTTAGQAASITPASSSGNSSTGGAAPIPATRPPNPRTHSSSSIASIRSAGSSTTNTTKLNAKGQSGIAMNASPASSAASSGLKGMHEDEIEASLRQWRNHVFPSLKAGNYISPGQETPDKDPIHPLVEPILPSIFNSHNNSNNLKCIPVIYENGKQFLDAIIEASTGSESGVMSTTKQSIQERSHESHGEKGVNEEEEEEEGEDYQSSWRLEMVLGQTRDLIQNNENAEGIWIALWSGEQATNTRLLEFCLMKLPSRPLVLSSPIPISLLPTALLQDRMQTLLNAFLSLPSNKNNSSPFSLVMGPTRVVEAFLLHYDSHPTLLTTANNSITGTSLSSSLSSSAGNTVDGMFEQSIQQNDKSPYPLKLSHPKYTAAMKAAASSANPTGVPSSTSSSASNLASASTITSKPGSAPSSSLEAALPKSTKEGQQQRGRSESTASLSIPSTSSSTSLASSSAAGASHHQQQSESNASFGSGDSALVLKQSASLSSSSIPANNGHITKPFQNSNIPQSQPQQQQKQIFLHSAAAGRTVKPLLHTRAKDIPPAVSLSEGFAVRLAEEKDDLRTLVSLFQAYSRTLDHTLEENAARRALQKAMANKSVWIYHIYSQSLPGLSLIAGFLTTERKRPYIGKYAKPKSEGGKGKGSIAITAVFTDEVFRSRGVAESLIRTSTRYYLVDLNFDYVSVYIDPRNEIISRVFSRVGFGILDRKINEEIPIKLIRNALFLQWDEEKLKYQNLLNKISYNNDTSLEGEDNHADIQKEEHPETDGRLNEETPTALESLKAARNTLSLLTAANQEVSQHTAEISPTTSTGNAESGNLLPTEEENEAALQAENGKPLCTSSEEWQVVSLRSREVALSESRSRIRGHTRRDDIKRLSSEGPWH